MECKNRSVINFLTALLILFILACAHECVFNKEGELLGFSFNLLVYLFVCVIAVFFYFSIMRLFDTVDKRIKLDGFYSCFNVLYLALMFIFVIAVYKNESKLYAGNTLPFIRERVLYRYLYAIFCSIVSFGLIYIVKCNLHSSKLFRCFTGIFFSFFGALLNYSPNVFCNLYHTHAYTNSIVNVMNKAPYSSTCCSIYGHYGLIYYPLVRLLGSDFSAILISISLFTGITYLCVSYIIGKIIKKDLLYVLSVVALVGLGTVFMSYLPYFQVLPHRCLFISIALACLTSFIAGLMKTITRGGRFCIELIIGILAIIFNLESGVIVVLLFFVFELLKNCSDFKHIAIALLYGLFLFSFCFAFSYLLVNIYNIVCGGSWNSIKEFIFPIGSSVFDISLLRIELPSPFNAYGLQLIVFVIAMCSSFYSIAARGDDALSHYLLLFAGLSGLVSLTYYFNRTAAGNISISHIQFVIICAILANEFINNTDTFNFASIFKNFACLHQSRYLFYSLLLAYFGFESLISVGLVLTSNTNSIWVTDTLKSDYSEVKEWIPSNIKAIGPGVPEIYYQCGYDYGIYTIDWSDMRPTYLADIEKQLQNENEIVISCDMSCPHISELFELLEKYRFYECDKFDGYNFTLAYYKK